MKPASRVLAHVGPFVLVLVVIQPMITVRWVQYLVLAMIAGLCLVAGVAMALAEAETQTRYTHRTNHLNGDRTA